MMDGLCTTLGDSWDRTNEKTKHLAVLRGLSSSSCTKKWVKSNWANLVILAIFLVFEGGHQGCRIAHASPQEGDGIGK